MSASLSRRFLFKGVSLAVLVFLFPLSKHLADVATAHTHTLHKYICSVVSATTIAVASVHPCSEPGYAISVITQDILTGRLMLTKLRIRKKQNKETVGRYAHRINLGQSDIKPSL